MKRLLTIILGVLIFLMGSFAIVTSTTTITKHWKTYDPNKQPEDVWDILLPDKYDKIEYHEMESDRVDTVRLLVGIFMVLGGVGITILGIRKKFKPLNFKPTLAFVWRHKPIFGLLLIVIIMVFVVWMITPSYSLVGSYKSLQYKNQYNEYYPPGADRMRLYANREFILVGSIIGKGRDENGEWIRTSGKWKLVEGENDYVYFYDKKDVLIHSLSIYEFDGNLTLSFKNNVTFLKEDN